LGLLGSGGAILTVPILVFVVGHDEKSAIAESLAIVGLIALAGVIRASLQKRVDFQNATLLALPGMVGTYFGAHVAKFLSGAFQLVLLAALMLTAAVMMFRGGRRRSGDSGEAPEVDALTTAAPRERRGRSALVAASQGTGLGFATGLVGVGGGFLIVPVLVLLRGLPMQTAIGTSLGVIAINSATGFLKYLAVLAEPVHPHGAAQGVDWSIIGVFSALGIAGSLLGNFLAGKIPAGTLKRLFAVFLVVMAGYILFRQAPRVLPDLFGHKAPAAGSLRSEFGTFRAVQTTNPSTLHSWARINRIDPSNERSLS
jgi:uncharacterized membrane protein YfcA